MFLRIEKGSAVPISRQIAEQIGMLCASGQLRRGRSAAVGARIGPGTGRQPEHDPACLRAADRRRPAGDAAWAGDLCRHRGQGRSGSPPTAQRLVDELRQVGRQSLALGLSPDELHGLLDEALEQLAAAAPAACPTRRGAIPMNQSANGHGDRNAGGR